MRTVLTHRIELKPNPRQEGLFRQSVGASRFAYNWALAEWQRQFEAGEKPNEAALRRQFNAIKPIEFPWILDLPKSIPQQAIKNVGRAYQLSGFSRNNRSSRASKNAAFAIRPGWTMGQGPLSATDRGFGCQKSAGSGCTRPCALTANSCRPP